MYHGPKGLVEIADRVHGLAVTLAAGAKKLGLKVPAAAFFDTVAVGVADADAVVATALKHEVRAASQPRACGEPAFAPAAAAAGAPLCCRASATNPTPPPRPPPSPQVNLRKLDAKTVAIAFDETTKLADVDLLLAVLNGGAAAPFTAASLAPGAQPNLGAFARTSSFMTQARAAPRALGRRRLANPAHAVGRPRLLPPRPAPPRPEP